MKLLPLVLVTSVAANAVLLGVYISSRKQDVKAVAPEAVQRSAADIQAAEQRAKNELRDKEVSSAFQVLLANSSGGYTGSDLKAFADRLRALGFPEAAVKAMVSGLVNDRVAARYKQIREELGKTQPGYWTANRYGIFGSNRDYMAKNRAINDERVQLLKDALGEKGAANESGFFAANRYGNLAPEKAEKLERIVQDYNELKMEINENAKGIMLPEDKEKLAFIDKEQKADLEQILTPDELFEYGVRSSSAANMLRSQMGAFEVTEDEFRAIYKTVADSGGANTFGPYGFSSDDYRKMQAAAKDGAKAIMSADRYAEFQQASDPQYAQVSRLAARLSLPPATAKEVMAVQQDTQKQLATIRSNQSLTSEQRTTQIRAISDSVTQKLTTTLGGSRGFEAYKQNGGQWMQMMTNTPSAGNRMIALPSGGTGSVLPAVSISGGK